MKLFKFALNTALFLVAAFYIPVATACSFVAWSASFGAVQANDPNNGVARVMGFCGMEVTDLGYVEHVSSAADESFIARFYFLPDLSETTALNAEPVDIFVAYKDDAATMDLFSIKFDGTNLIFDATAAGGTAVSVAADLTHWNLIEFEWVSDTTGDFWVDADATSENPTATFTPGTGAVNAIRLGLPNGLGTLSGMGTFDDYQSQRTLPVGPLLICDVNGDGEFSLNDILDVITEKFGNPPMLAPGTADCNLDGVVDLNDILESINVVFPPAI